MEGIGQSPGTGGGEDVSVTSKEHWDPEYDKSQKSTPQHILVEMQTTDSAQSGDSHGEGMGPLWRAPDRLLRGSPRGWKMCTKVLDTLKEMPDRPGW